MPYCPRCGTALSSHEVAQGYKDVTETSVYVKFRVRGQENTFLLAWTTTPWTLPSNVALVVNEHEDYVYAEKDGETYILAKALCEKVVGEGAKVLRTVKGAELIGTEYEPLYPFAGKTRERGWYVVADGLRHPHRRHGHRPPPRRPSARTTRAWAAKTACPLCSWSTPRAALSTR